MDQILDWLLSSTIIYIPFLILAAEAIASFRVSLFKYSFSGERCEDFMILVPIWGSVRYLENVEYLSKYRSRVMLCTTGDENAEFYEAMEELVREHGFQLFRDEPSPGFEEKQRRNPGQRTTSGSMRDTVIRNALRTVTATYVVSLDADSTSEEDLSILIGELKHRGFDMASVRIEPSNRNSSILARMQTLEYGSSMRFKFLCPWLISGACHIGKTDVFVKVMNKHSLFFQGNDVETGLLAKTLGYDVGHIPFVVLTVVPDNFRNWFKQRLAWAGGEFRLFIVNYRFILRHPIFWIYGGLITICMFPLRWGSLASLTPQLYIMLGLYLVLVFCIHWRRRSCWLFLMPVYSLLNSLVMTPLGVFWYFRMAIKDRNRGVITIKRNEGGE